MQVTQDQEKADWQIAQSNPQLTSQFALKTTDVLDL